MTFKFAGARRFVCRNSRYCSIEGCILSPLSPIIELLLFYHSHTDSATCGNKEYMAQMLHLLRHVGAFFDLNVPEKGTSPARGPSVRESFCSHRCAFQTTCCHAPHEQVLTMKTRRSRLMKRHWTNEELVEHWTLSSKELDLIGDSKADHNLLGAACLLKYFQYEGRFPAQKQDVPPIVIVHLAQQLGVVPEKIIPYDWEGRTIKAHRAAIRTFLEVHEATLADEEALVEWLCQEVLAEQL